MVNDVLSLFKRINEKPWYEWIISGVLFIFIAFFEIGQWIIIVGMLFKLFGIDYVGYAHLVPFECMYKGENISFVILVAALVFATLVGIYLSGSNDVKVIIIIFEILAIGIAVYIVFWVIAVAFVMVLAGLRFGKLTMVAAFLIVIIIHGLFLLLRKISISTRQ